MLLKKKKDQFQNKSKSIDYWTVVLFLSFFIFKDNFVCTIRNIQWSNNKTNLQEI